MGLIIGIIIIVLGFIALIYNYGMLFVKNILMIVVLALIILIALWFGLVFYIIGNG